MVVLWMGYATLVTALLAAGAWAADGALGALGWPRRWAWAVAVAGGLALPAWGAWMRPRSTAAPAVQYVITMRASGASAVGHAAGAVAGWRVVAAPTRADGGLARAERAAAAATRALAPFDGAALGAWLLASGAGLAYVARGAWTVRRQRRGWRSAIVAGERVWLAPDLGPALVGAVRPRVVLPAWLPDALDADGLRLVLAHERAHAAAGDPMLLACALGALVVAPWNAALWVAARRLRLAAEADCDRRVLRAHPGARRYARLLVDVAERALGVPGARGAMATALLDPPGLLERRVGWLLGTERGGAWRAPRVAGALAGATAVAVLACAVPRPALVSVAPLLPAPALAPGEAVRFEASAACVTDAGCVAAKLTAARIDTVTLRRAPDTVGRHARRDAVAYAQLKETYDALEPAQSVRTPLVRTLPQDTVPQRPDTTIQRPAEVGPAEAARPSTLLLYGRANRAPLIQGLAADSNGFPTPTALRALVTRHFPQALTGTMGHTPYVWLALDEQGRVTNSATGPAGLASVPFVGHLDGYDYDRVPRVTDSVAPIGRRLVLDARSARLKFPALTADRIGSVSWTHLAAGQDTVQLFLIAPPTPR